MKTRLITAAVGVPFLIFALVVRGLVRGAGDRRADVHRDAWSAIARWAKRATTSATWGGYAAAVGDVRR